MTQKLSVAIIAGFVLFVPQYALASTTSTVSVESKVVEFAKSIVLPSKKVFSLITPQVALTKELKTLTCVACKSQAEGVDTASARTTVWQGTVIGVNEGERSLVITDATKLNRIKAYAQRAVVITDETIIIDMLSEEKTFSHIDIGYRIAVRGEYDANNRVVSARLVQVIEVPDEPVTTTK